MSARGPGSEEPETAGRGGRRGLAEVKSRRKGSPQPLQPSAESGARVQRCEEREGTLEKVIIFSNWRIKAILAVLIIVDPRHCVKIQKTAWSHAFYF